MYKWIGLMKVIKISVFLLLNFIINSVLATEAVDFRITQSSIQLPNITAWIDISNDSGKRVVLSPEQLSATLGSNAATINDVKPFSEKVSGTAFIFLIDVSKSLKPAYFAQIQSALNTWVAGMNEYDRAALISFGSQVKVLQDFSSNKSVIKEKIDLITPNNMDTFLYQGLVQALELGRRQDASLPKRRVIVVLTDGIDDAAGGVTKEEVLLKIAENRIPIYAIGYAMPPLTPIKENGLKELGVLARTSGGHFLKANAMPLIEAYKLQKERIDSSYEVIMFCNTCIAEGQLSRLNITFNADGHTLNDGLDVRLIPVSEVPTKAPKVLLGLVDTLKGQIKVTYEKYPYLSSVTLALLFLIILGSLLYIKKRKNAAHEKMIASASSAITGNEAPNDKGHYLNDIFPVIKKATVQPPKYSLSFTVVTGDEPGKCYTIKLNDSAIIGRASDCDLSIGDSEVSARHAEIKFEKGILVIKDLGSMNGTLINGVPIHTVHYLQDGDQILIGRTELRLNGLEDSNAN